MQPGIRIGIGFVFLLFFSLGGLPLPSVKKLRKTKPMPMPQTLHILRFVGYETKFVGYIPYKNAVPYAKNMSDL